MGQPGQLGSPVRNDGDLMRMFADLQRQIQELAAANVLATAGLSVQPNQLTVNGDLAIRGNQFLLDPSGNQKVRLGSLNSAPGQYGLEVLVGSTWVPIASTAAGGNRTTVAGQYDLNTPAGTNTGWVACGPVLSVTTYTGKLDVTVGTALSTTGSRSKIVLSYTIATPGGTVVVSPDEFQGPAARHNGTGMTAYGSGEMTLSHVLDPGTYVVTAQAQTWASTTEATTANLTNRTLGVRGY